MSEQQSAGVRRIHACVLAAMNEIASRGIAKMSSASLGGSQVKYRGIEVAMNEMSVVLIHSGITVTPEYSELVVQDRAKYKDGKEELGKFTRFATIKGSYTFEADDGSTVKATYYGEAMDSGDKAVIKAQSVAFRTALFQTFVVPTMAMDTEVDDGTQAEEETAIAARESELEEMALAIIEAFIAGQELEALSIWQNATNWNSDQSYANDERKWVWGKFNTTPKLKAFLKANDRQKGQE